MKDSSTVSATFRANLRRLRLLRGVSISGLARRVGVQPSYICDLEQGRRKGVHSKTLVKIAVALDVGAGELMTMPNVAAPKEIKEISPATP
jgi:transcriptional regulator with XRE-family HTH domain